MKAGVLRGVLVTGLQTHGDGIDSLPRDRTERQTRMSAVAKSRDGIDLVCHMHAR